MKVCCFFVFFSLVAIAKAQPDSSTFVYLRNGVSLMGEVERQENGDLQMRQAIGNEFTIERKDIRYYLAADDIIMYKKRRYHLAQGFFMNVSLGLNLENLSNEDTRISSHLTILQGYHFPKKYTLALGLAVEFNQAEIAGFTLDTQFLPVFLYGRYYLTDWRARTFAYGRVGYGFRAEEELFNNDHSGGFQCQAGGGVHFASRKKSRFLLSLGYHLQKTEGMESYLDQFGLETNVIYDIWIHRLILTVGMEIGWGIRRH